jgi:1-aminocyclopropane-1-carboxylate deaminase/D-cysteine desulfhydrase-like pyridoxal-dependent ACC family enzyme
MATALATLLSLPAISLTPGPTPLQPLNRFAAALGPTAPRLFIKRDDLLPFGFGGVKVRKLQTVAADAKAAGADTLITCGSAQSNHARVTAAVGAALGMDVHLVLNGKPISRPTGNLLLSQLFGAAVHFVDSRGDRAPAMENLAHDLRSRGRCPFVIPLGASTAIGVAGMASAIGEVAAAGLKPDFIYAATSSGGTQAGIVAGCALFGLRTRVVGVSADDPAATIVDVVRGLLKDLAPRLGASASALGGANPVEVDDNFVGAGYGSPTEESAEALGLLARTEGILLDPVYTAKAMAALIASIRAGDISIDRTVLFWHTGGVPALFA